MCVPKKYDRWPTMKAIESLSARFSIPIPTHCQDWHYVVADPIRLDEFLSVFCEANLTADERFTLGEMVMQCFDEILSMGAGIEGDQRWRTYITELNKRPLLHAHTFYYWSCLSNTLEDAFHVTRYARQLLEIHKPLLEN